MGKLAQQPSFHIASDHEDDGGFDLPDLVDVLDLSSQTRLRSPQSTSQLLPLNTNGLRRSPRKQKQAKLQDRHAFRRTTEELNNNFDQVETSSNQQRQQQIRDFSLSPSKRRSPAKREPLSLTQPRTAKDGGRRTEGGVEFKSQDEKALGVTRNAGRQPRSNNKLDLSNVPSLAQNATQRPPLNMFGLAEESSRNGGRRVKDRHEPNGRKATQVDQIDGLLVGMLRMNFGEQSHDNREAEADQRTDGKSSGDEDVDSIGRSRSLDVLEQFANQRQSTELTSRMSKITRAARQDEESTSLTPAYTTSTKSKRTKKGSGYTSRFVLQEAACDDDLNDSSDGGRRDDDEDEDTDLSGFIVDDDAELTIYGSDSGKDNEDSSTEEETYSKRYKDKTKTTLREVCKMKPCMDLRSERPRRRLQRGRRNPSVGNESTEDDETSPTVDSFDEGLFKALMNLNLGQERPKKQRESEKRSNIEVIDLTSSPVATIYDSGVSTTTDTGTTTATSFENDLTPVADAFLLKPTVKTESAVVPVKPLRQQVLLVPSTLDGVNDETEEGSLVDREQKPSTPTATPPGSPRKLKSPSKPLSPRKGPTEALRSPYRQSMDAFWDHNVVNEWNDSFSPEKPIPESPRKNPLARYQMWSDSESHGSNEDEDELSLNNSSDSLPSPCESPSKTKLPSKPRETAPSPSKEARIERQRIAEEKRAKAARRRDFDSQKQRLANELLLALDRHVTNSQISRLAGSTGGVQVKWSKTLRSTAGRANWRRTVTKPSGSPVKQAPSLSTTDDDAGRGANVSVCHYAYIELAEKVIDRPDRLVNTVAHEFCHLANFMVSGVRDQPHGESFKKWAVKVTKWMKSQGQHPEWKEVEVTTKHGYVIEHKYLWVCAGRPHRPMSGFDAKLMGLSMEEASEGTGRSGRSKSGEESGRDPDDGCGAEYGRHSKSIDVDKHRCGRCKGFLVQVRPTPRAASPEKKKDEKSRSQSQSPKKKKVDFVASGDGNDQGRPTVAVGLQNSPTKKRPQTGGKVKKVVSVTERMIDIVDLED